MATLFGDGFDFYSATADLIKKWASLANGNSVISFSATGGRNGGGALSLAGVAVANFITTPIFGVAGAGSTGKIFADAFWFKCATPPSNTWILKEVDSVAGVRACRLSINLAGVLVVAGNSSGITGLKNICDGQWHWVEWRCDNTTTTAAVRAVVDGVSDINSTVASGIPATMGYVVTLCSNNQAATAFIDDIVHYDEVAGPTGDLNASTSFPLGPMQFTSKTTQADGVVGFSTATGGTTHYDQVDETSADSDTSYVESAVSNDQDLYDFAAMGVSPSTIKTIIANAFVKNPNVGTINFKQIAKSGATQTDGTSIAVPAAYTTIQQSFPQDPNTSAAWASASAVDAATFGVKVV